MGNDNNEDNDVNNNLDNYEFVRELGRGEFGMVSLYRAKNRSTKVKLIAVKQINIQPLSEKEKKKLLGESKILSMIKIIQIS